MSHVFQCVVIQDGVTAVMFSVTHRASIFKLRDNAVNYCFVRHRIIWKFFLETTHMIYYENNASQPKFFVHDLEPSFLIKKLPFSPAQYTSTRTFSTLLTDQLHEVL
jgi:hypothetical protein